jgi:hypothetical protein
LQTKLFEPFEILRHLPTGRNSCCRGYCAHNSRASLIIHCKEW